MNDGIKFTKDLQDSVKKSRIITYVSATLALVISLSSITLAFLFMFSQRHQVYVLDEGSVLQAYRTDNQSQRDLECVDHVRHFHEIFFNLAPSQEFIYNAIERSLDYADKSVYNYSQDLKESQYYTRLIQANASQEISVDSVKVDISQYPYKAHTYATTFVIRESNISRYFLETTCDLTENQRSDKNPHGLMIEKFVVTRYDFDGTKNRK